MSTWTRAALTVLIGLIIWFLPHTEAIKPEGWHLLAIFTATIVGFILRPWPTGIMALFGIVAAVATPLAAEPAPDATPPGISHEHTSGTMLNTLAPASIPTTYIQVVPMACMPNAPMLSQEAALCSSLL